MSRQHPTSLVLRAALLTALSTLGAWGCEHGKGSATSAPTSGLVVAPVVTGSTSPVSPSPDSAPDLTITYDPRVSGHFGWVALPRPVPLHMIGSPGAVIFELTADRIPFPPGDPARSLWFSRALAGARPGDSTLVVDEESVCSPQLAAAVHEASPPRLLLTFPNGLTQKAVGCVGALATERLYLAGCLHRPHRADDTCDGDAEIAALTANEGLRPRVRGLAVSLSTAESVKALGKLPGLEYLALSPGRGAGNLALVDALPFGALPHVRYLEASGENRRALTWDREALRFVGHLHTLHWNGELRFPVPAPCALERVWFDRLRAGDVKALSACGSLKELSSDDVDIDSAEPLAGFSELVRLHLRHLRAEPLSPLARLQKLQALDLPASGAADFSFLSTMSSLVELDLSQTSLASLAPVAGLAALEQLDIGFTAVSDVSPLAALSRLEGLRLHATKVADIGPLAGLSRLKELSISETAVTRLEPLGKLPLLEWVILYDTKVTDVKPLLGLPALKRVNIRGVKIPEDQRKKLRERGDLRVDD